MPELSEWVWKRGYAKQTDTYCCSTILDFVAESYKIDLCLCQSFEEVNKKPADEKRRGIEIQLSLMIKKAISWLDQHFPEIPADRPLFFFQKIALAGRMNAMELHL